MESEEFNKMLAALPEVESVRRATLQPGDVVVVKLDKYLSDESHAGLLKLLQAVFPNNKCIVLQAGLDIEIIRAQQ